MALVNPNIAMSYRPTVEYQPRNALADYAQVQQIMGGQRQMEMADMQMEDLRRERDALSRIQAAIVSKGGPPDLAAAADEMIRTGRPQFVNQGRAIQESLKKQQYFNKYEQLFGAGRPAPAMPSTAPGSITGAAPNGLLAQATSPTAPAAQPSAARPTAAPFVPKDATTSEILKEYGEEAAKFYQDNGYLFPGTFTRLTDRPQVNPEIAARAAERDGFGKDMEALGIRLLTPEQQAASPYKTLEDFIVPSSRSQTSAGLPSAAAPTNAMLAGQTSAPPANVNQLASANAGANINDLMQQYSLAAKGGHPMAPAILKQIEAALRGDQNKPITVSRGQVVIDPRTGQQIFAAPEAAASLSDRFVPVGKLVFDRQTQQYISPTQAQLAQSQESAGTAAAVSTPARTAGKPPIGYRFTPTGDLEPIPGGPAARAAEGAAAAQPRPLTAAQEAARRDKLGKEFKSATAALQTTQEVLDSISFVRAEPGLSRATGFTGMLPSIPEGAAASAETRLANLKGKITALGKAAAASSGAIGSIANEEWKILADQIAAIDPVKGTGPLLQQLELVEAQAQGAMARIQDAYQRQFGEDFARFPQFSNLPAPQSSFKPATPANRSAAPASGGVDTNNPLLR
jgi:hypothetical protein